MPVLSTSGIDYYVPEGQGSAILQVIMVVSHPWCTHIHIHAQIQVWNMHTFSHILYIIIMSWQLAVHGSAKIKAILDWNVSKDDTAQTFVKRCEVLIYGSHLIQQDIVGEQMRLNIKSGREAGAGKILSLLCMIQYKLNPVHSSVLLYSTVCFVPLRLYGTFISADDWPVIDECMLRGSTRWRRRNTRQPKTLNKYLWQTQNVFNWTVFKLLSLFRLFNTWP